MSENNETVAELLREWRDEGEHIQCSMCRAAVGYDFCVSNECPDAWGALADRVEAEIAEARDLRAREGMAIIAEAEGWPPLHDGESVTEWMARCWLSRPLYEDGEPVQMGDRYLMANGSHDTVSSLSYSKGSVDYVSINGRRRMLSERVRRPAPEVLLADGEPAKRGETVWRTTTGHEGTVDGTEDGMVLVRWADTSLIDCPVDPAWLTSTPPVLAADGKPLREGDAVWLTDEGARHAGKSSCGSDDEPHSLHGIESNSRLTVRSIRNDSVKCVLLDEYKAYCPAAWLTHEEPDSLERIDADARNARIGAVSYWRCGDDPCDKCPATVGGETPRERYGVMDCRTAATLDLLARQRVVLARGGEQ